MSLDRTSIGRIVAFASPICLVVALLVISARGSNEAAVGAGAAAAEATPSESPATIFGYDASGVQEILAADLELRERVVQRCMSEAGFEYFPQVVDDLFFGPDSASPPDLGSAPPPDANALYVESLPAAEQRDYQTALVGGVLGTESASKENGCQGFALDMIPGPVLQDAALVQGLLAVIQDNQRRSGEVCSGGDYGTQSELREAFAASEISPDEYIDLAYACITDSAETVAARSADTEAALAEYVDANAAAFAQLDADLASSRIAAESYLGE